MNLRCPCGRTLHSTDEGLWRQFASFVLTPAEMEAYDAFSVGGDDMPDLRELWRCECGRIAIDTTAVGNAVQWYAPIVWDEP